MKIKIVSLILAVTLCASTFSLVYAAEDTSAENQPDEQAEEVFKFYLDGEPVPNLVYERINGSFYITLSSFMSQVVPEAVVEDDSSSVTVRSDLVILTNPESGETSSEEPVEIVLDTLTLSAKVGNQYAVANGRYLYAADGILTVDGSVAVPIRLLAKVMGYSVEYDAENDLVLLSSSEEVGYIEDGDSFYDSDGLYWLSRIICCESENQCLKGKIAVGNVVMNRVESDQFPNTIYSVIFQKNQFSPASSGKIYNTPSDSSVIAAKLVLDGAVVVDNALFFNRAGQSSYASRNRTYVTTIGDHAFYS